MIPWEEDIIIYNFVSCFFVRFKRFCNCPKLFGSLHVKSQTTQKQQRRPQGNLSMSHRSSIHLHSIILAIIKTLERGQTQISFCSFNQSLHQTRILKNQEACANTLSMECMEFYHRCSESLTALGKKTEAKFLPNPAKVRERRSELHKSSHLRLLLRPKFQP